MLGFNNAGQRVFATPAGAGDNLTSGELFSPYSYARTNIPGSHLNLTHYYDLGATRGGIYGGLTGASIYGGIGSGLNRNTPYGYSYDVPNIGYFRGTLAASPYDGYAYASYPYARYSRFTGNNCSSCRGC